MLDGLGSRPKPLRSPRTPAAGPVVVAALLSAAVFGGCGGVNVGAGVDLGNVFLGGTTGVGVGTRSQGLDSSTVAAGLREALRVGSERAVASTSATDGFFGNELIRLGMPAQLQTMADTLTTVGFGEQVRELEVAMNRAAEQASGEALAVFTDQIAAMSIGDAKSIWTGGPTAATDYFRTNTSAELRERFAPIVAEKVNEAGLARAYATLAQRYAAIPFVTQPTVSLEDHVTDGALDGLFTVLGNEERRIRDDPAARTTDLLQKVFAR